MNSSAGPATNSSAGPALNARAAQALRLVAGVYALLTGVGVVCFGVDRWLIASLSEPGASSQTFIHRLEMLGDVQNWSAIGGDALVLVGLALLFSSLVGRGRALVAGALGALALVLALMVFDRLVPAVASTQPPYRYPAMRQALWIVRMVAAYASQLLTLLGARPAPLARGRERTATRMFMSLVAALFAFKLISMVATPSGTVAAEVFQIAWYTVDFGADLAFILAAVWLARALGVPADAHAVGPGQRDPAPLRLFGRAIIVRVAAGVPLVIIATVAAQAAPELAVLALVAATIVSLIAAGMLVTSLLGQRRFPEGLCDAGALTLAITVACLGPVLDIWGAVATGQLLSLVSEAKRATSFWGMPSLRRIEDLQAAATWTGRISICLGLIGSFAIVRSLTATARGLVDEVLAVRAGRVRALLIYGTGGAITAWIFISNASLRGEGALLALVLIGVVLLTIGVVLCVELLRLTFGLAAAIERPPPPPAISPAFPS